MGPFFAALLFSCAATSAADTKAVALQLLARERFAPYRREVSRSTVDATIRKFVPPRPFDTEDYADPAVLERHIRDLSDVALDFDERLVSELAQCDWNRLAAILEDFSEKPSPVFRAFATGWRYQHALHTRHDAIAQELRIVLTRIAVDKSGPAAARRIAFEALFIDGLNPRRALEADFAGDEQLVCLLLADDTFREIRESNVIFQPMRTLLWSNPDRWAPLFARQQTASAIEALSSVFEDSPFWPFSDRTKHIAAGAIVQWSRTQKSKSYPELRTAALRDVARSGRPEALLILRAAVESETSDWVLLHSAVLARVPGAAQRLRQQIESLDVYGRASAREALVIAGGYTTEEMTQAVIEYAAAAPQAWNDMLGRIVIEEIAQHPDVAHALIERFESIGAGRAVLLRMMTAWPIDVARSFVIDRIAAGETDVPFLAHAIRNSENLRRQAAAATGKTASPILFVIAGDTAAAANLLRNGSADQQMMVLAAARLGFMSLPLSDVEAATANASEAVRAYLAASDEPAAAEALARIEGEPKIAGSELELRDPDEPAWDIACDCACRPMRKVEEAARRAFMESDDRERIFVLVQNGFPCPMVFRVLGVHIGAGGSTIETDGASRSLSEDEVKELREMVVRASAGTGRRDSLSAEELLYFTRASARRIVLP